jgi:Fe2+ or Zn2+ uptake regulation protein
MVPNPQERPGAGRDNHHVVWRSCGAIADVDCAVGTTRCLAVSDSYGFTIDEAEVSYWGRCPGCVSRQLLPCPAVDC